VDSISQSRDVGGSTKWNIVVDCACVSRRSLFLFFDLLGSNGFETKKARNEVCLSNHNHTVLSLLSNFLFTHNL
jgi:hypothetical protein